MQGRRQVLFRRVEGIEASLGEVIIFAVILFALVKLHTFVNRKGLKYFEELNLVFYIFFLFFRIVMIISLYFSFIMFTSSRGRFRAELIKI